MTEKKELPELKDWSVEEWRKSSTDLPVDIDVMKDLNALNAHVRSLSHDVRELQNSMQVVEKQAAELSGLKERVENRISDMKEDIDALGKRDAGLADAFRALRREIQAIAGEADPEVKPCRTCGRRVVGSLFIPGVHVDCTTERICRNHSEWQPKAENSPEKGCETCGLIGKWECKHEDIACACWTPKESPAPAGEAWYLKVYKTRFGSVFAKLESGAELRIAHESDFDPADLRTGEPEDSTAQHLHSRLLAAYAERDSLALKLQEAIWSIILS